MSRMLFAAKHLFLDRSRGGRVGARPMKRKEKYINDKRHHSTGTFFFNTDEAGKLKRFPSLLCSLTVCTSVHLSNASFNVVI